MLFEPLLGTSLSGKVGGLVASHNAGGAYFRAASIPTNPNTPFQQAVRTAVAGLTAAWQSTLTQEQRDAWEEYASNVTITNRIGKQVNISGLAMFVRSNVGRLQNLLPSILIAPVIFNLGQFLRGTAFNAIQSAQTVDVVFGQTIPTDPWISEAGSYMFVYISRQQNSGIKFFKGPYRLAGALQGDPTPPTSPFTVSVPFAINEGDRLFMRTVVAYADGRFTAPEFSNVLIAA